MCVCVHCLFRYREGEREREGEEIYGYVDNIIGIDFSFSIAIKCGLFVWIIDVMLVPVLAMAKTLWWASSSRVLSGLLIMSWALTGPYGPSYKWLWLTIRPNECVLWVSHGHQRPRVWKNRMNKMMYLEKVYILLIRIKPTKTECRYESQTTRGRVSGTILDKSTEERDTQSRTAPTARKEHGKI